MRLLRGRPGGVRGVLEGVSGVFRVSKSGMAQVELESGRESRPLPAPLCVVARPCAAGLGRRDAAAAALTAAAAQGFTLVNF
jgi:hypothetical protein